ncbi:enoyl-CoA hydratase-related protein [Paractinoplanes deccanensis]|uniref:enoyl-CoA hydratase-related protein n=1 Tax=Paractinoplanes deccanensis TaxID=113561 RepID=UPI001941D4C8|nr:enoyl-CoA hydratase-related protein [Actinoplanes deccanensis]
MTSTPLHVDLDGAVATVTITGTAAGNALGGAAFGAIPATLDSLAADDRVGAIVLRGAGDTFSVGLDLRWYLPAYRRVERSGDERAAARRALHRQTRTLQRAVTAVEECPVPVVAAVAGQCVGAALELVTACDLRIASADAVFIAAEVDIGVVADLGLLQRLPRIVGAGATADLALTGREVDAAEALRLGLVSRVADEPAVLYPLAAATAARIARAERHVTAGIKQVLRASRDLSVEQGLALSAVWSAAFLPSTGFADRLRDRMATTAERSAP